MRDGLVFALAATKNLYEYLPVNVFNIIRTNSCKKIYIFIEDDELNLPFPHIIQYINMHKIGLDESGANYHTHFSIATLCRLYLADLVDEDKIIYCDMDTAVIGSLQELWDMNIDNYYVAGAVDKGILDYKEYVEKFCNPETYINTGVILLNLKKIRDDHKTKMLTDYVNNQKLAFPDQDAINCIFKDKILYIDSKFNAGLSTEIPRKFIVYHWAGEKKNWVYDREFSNIWTQSERAFIAIFAQPIMENKS